jgi:hypothetical protein
MVVLAQSPLWLMCLGLGFFLFSIAYNMIPPDLDESAEYRRGR